jgi:hypothetical protein
MDILKYTVPSLVVLLATVIIVRKFLAAQIQEKQLTLLKDNQDVTVRLRLQAYERLALFIERIHPRQLVPRVYEPGMTVSILQQVLIMNIKTEFEHNLSQQIYVTKAVWDSVRGVKEQELNMINTMARQLEPDAPAKELHSRMVDYLVSTEGDLPIDVALKYINEEAKLVLSYGAMG